jgi:hypothetical protein
MLVLNCSVLVQRRATIRIPSLCYASAPVGRVLGSPVIPGLGSTGWVACAHRQHRLDLFGHQEAVRLAGRRRLSLPGPCSGAARADAEALVAQLFRLQWQRVRSAGLGSEWVASKGPVRGSSLYLDGHLIHCHLTRFL